MIKITIELVTYEKYTETKNFITKSTPTDKVQPRSNYESDKVLCIEEYATRDVPMERTVRLTLLSQEIPNEEAFSLPRVIAAINGLSEARP